ncbi:MAG: putative beta-lysine N-acetyltransferase [Bacillota bacterium]
MAPKKKEGRFEEISGANYQAEIHLSPLNKRIVIKEYQGSNLKDLVSNLIVKAQKNELSKIWVKARAEDEPELLKLGFKSEAVIKNYYPNCNAVSMAYYLNEERRELIEQKEKRIINELQSNNKIKEQLTLPQNYSFKLAAKDDLKELASLYEQVFDSYPYPIDKKEYLKKMLEKDVIYGLIYDGAHLAAAASAETVPQYKNAEMTDFATLENYRGQGLGSYLLRQLEQVLENRDYNCLYTIARAKIMGINKIFSQADYQYTGRLIQNCNIAGGLEDMNLWCKTIN